MKGLPPDAAIWRRQPELGGWTVTDHLIASLIEVTDAAAWRSLLPHLKKGFKPQPITVPRPGQHTQRRSKKRKATSADLKEIFGGGATITHGGL